MSDSHTGGVVVGVLLVLFLFPLAIMYGALSVAFHRGEPADTFARGVGLPCRIVTYITGVGVVAWLFVFAMLIDFQMTMLLFWSAIVVGVAYLITYRPGPIPKRGGGVL